jgi:acetone carboxylase beta subunit
MPKKNAAPEFLISLDAGGTMTDCYLSDEDGIGYLGKSLTRPGEQAISYVESVEDAAEGAGFKLTDVHESARLVTYAGTTLTNIVVEGKGARVGLLATRGFEHYSELEGALTWLGQSRQEQANWQLHRHTQPMVNARDVRGISERVLGGSPFETGPEHSEGAVVIPLNEGQVRTAVEELIDSGVEVIAIWFLCSYANPSHEQRAQAIAAEVIAERGAEAPVLTSSDLCPRRGETSRLKSTLLEAFGAARTREQLLAVEKAARELGSERDLSTLVSYGAITNVRHKRLYETVVAGPIGGMLGGKALSDLREWRNVICSDLGGTSFDVGTIINGLTTISNSMDFAGHRLNVSSMQIDSIGAGAGSEISVDPRFKRVSLGPVSAGSNVGTCYRHPTISVADIDLVLGYLPAENFLGGKITLDVEEARRRLQADLADPLEMDLYDACWGVIELLHDQLGDHINGSLVSRGLNPGDYTVLVYGGSGPLHLWGLAERIEAKGICTVPWAAAFSAWGISVGESFYRLEQAVNATVSMESSEEHRLDEGRKLDAAWRELERQAIEELGPIGIDPKEITFQYGFTARYVGQLFASWSAHADKGVVESSDDVNDLVERFEEEFGRIYPSAGRFPDAGYRFDSVFVEAMIPKVRPAIPQYERIDPAKTVDPFEQRQAYWDGEWLEFSIYDMDALDAGSRVNGPAVIQHSMTTFVVPPGKAVEFDEFKVIWYGSAEAEKLEPPAE